MEYSAALKDYTEFLFDDGRWRRTVFRRGHGPAVIIIHEMPGLHPLCVRFADRVAASGMTVFLPSLFGTPGRPASVRHLLSEIIKTICIRREFNVWTAGKSSPIVDWLRALANQVHRECVGKGVGAVGMCFTGGFALAMMTERCMVAPVLSQPSLPLAIGSKKRAAGIDLSTAEIACARYRFEREDLSLIGLRFLGGQGAPHARFDSYRQSFGKRFEAIEINSENAEPGSTPPHSALTINLQDRPGTPTKKAEERVIAFFRERTNA